MADTQLGGDDFDNLLLDHVAEEFLGIHDIDLRKDRVSRNRLLHAVEAAKKKLSDHPVRPARGGVHRRESRACRCI